MSIIIKKVVVDDLFTDGEEPAIGSRLGVNFVRANSECIVVKVGGQEISLQQSHMGLLGISGVIWDCGLLMVDFLTTCCAAYANKHEFPFFDLCGLHDPAFCLGNTLDLGCGTGVCGTAAFILGAKSISFSDISLTSVMEENFAELRNLSERTAEQQTAVEFQLKPSITFVEYNWKLKILPDILLYSGTNDKHAENPQGESQVPSTAPALFTWDTVLCSDVLYEQSAHEGLLHILTSIQFRRLFLTYKRRHDDAEKEFIRLLADKFDVYSIDINLLELSNLMSREKPGLFAFVVVPKPENST